jgi:hypothetical protein
MLVQPLKAFLSKYPDSRIHLFFDGESVFQARSGYAKGQPQKIAQISIQWKEMNIGSWGSFSVSEPLRSTKSLKNGRKSLKGILETGQPQPMKILFIYEPAEEIGMPSGREGGREKRIGFQ